MTEAKNNRPEFTPMQEKAISTPDKTLLVSAGAGSGKTTVLTQRLIERIKAKGKVTEFLVVTFMKAAAADIKRKLYDALLEEISADPNNDHLYHQSLLVSEANICTISSYCLNLVKENFALLGISPKVRVMDETEAAMMLRNVADELIAKGYDSSDAAFLLIADNFTGDKNDTPLADSMIRLFNSLRVTLGREEMLLSCAQELRSEAAILREQGFFATNIGKAVKTRLERLYDEFIEEANEIRDFAEVVAIDEKYLIPLDKLVQAFESVRASLNINYVNYCSLAETAFLKLSLSRTGCDEDSRKIISERKKKLMDEHSKVRTRYVRGNDEYNAESFEKCADIVLAINSFLNSLEKGYERAKLENGVLDYTDFEQKALQLLETRDENGNYQPTELCLKKRAEFTEILIDEYQDVNPMQDRLFNLLAGDGRRFMVGDIKQSIYRFRNAYPDIFIGYKEAFPNIENADGSKNACIFLRENFRCGEAVINYVNFLFESITNGTPYYREYDGEWLVKATKRNDMKHPVTIAVADKAKGKAVEARCTEAEYIANEIRRLMLEETDDEGNKFKFSDFAVMLGAMKGYSIEYEKAFRKFGIPYKTETSENFLENPDIRLAVSSLKAIDDPTDDISLCSLMRSPIANFDSNDLYSIRKRVKDVAFWYALEAIASPKRAERITQKRFSFIKRSGKACLTIRCRAFVKRINEWRYESTGVPCRDFLKSFFVSSGLLRIASANGSRESLLLLFDYASRYETPQNQGLSGFLDYLSELSNGDREISDAARAGDEAAVSFITVHKSKGLEFKVCFLAGCEKQFRGLKNSSDITLLRGKGIFFRLRDRVKFTSFDPLCNIHAADEERDAAKGEELRKLYVALTRAKERLYITGSAEEGWREKRYSRDTAKSWLDMVLYASLGTEREFFTLRTIEKSDVEASYREFSQCKQLDVTREILDIVTFEYPYPKAVNAAAKISVSELREGLLEDDEYNRTVLSVPASRVSMRPAFASDIAISAADIGTANHLFMQFSDFARVESEGVEKEAKRLLDIQMLTAEQYEMLEFKALERFFESELYLQIRSSKRVYREKRFSVSDTDKASGEKMLVQGVIDCFFENPDGSYTVVDYKTDRVKTLQELADRHRVQLDYYRRAVERMTGKSVSVALLYSFALNGTIGI